MYEISPIVEMKETMEKTEAELEIKKMTTCC